MEKEKTKEELFKEFQEFTTYHDIMFLGHVFTKIKYLTTDSNSWHRAFFEVCEKYKEKIPELKDIFFDTSRPPLPPMSDEYYNFLAVAMMSRIFQGVRDNAKIIPVGTKRILIDQHANVMEKYGEETFLDIAEIFDKHLKPKKQGS